MMISIIVMGTFFSGCKEKFQIGKFNSDSTYLSFIEGKNFELYYGNKMLATVNVGNLK